MVHNNRGLALSHLGEFSAAKESFQKALALSADSESDDAQHAKAHLLKAQIAGCDFEMRDEHASLRPRGSRAKGARRATSRRET
jgi:Tfp pilus assembly protein PilF